MNDCRSSAAPRIGDRIWTSSRRRSMVIGLYFDLHFDTADIAEELSMQEAKVLAILDEYRADELANDQVQGIVGPAIRLSDPAGEVST